MGTVAMAAPCKDWVGVMTPAARSLLLRKPAVLPPLDPDFAPVILAKRAYLEAAVDCSEVVEWALPRADGCGRGRLPVFPEGHENASASLHFCGVLIQEMMWERGATKLFLAGPKEICAALQAAFAPSGKYSFDVLVMPKISSQAHAPFEVIILGSAEELPVAKDSPQKCGHDATGCRLAFDLGGSTIKTAAVKDGEVLCSNQTEWDCTKTDPQYHRDMILGALKGTAEKLPRVDAIGGCSAGVINGNSEPVFCDIFNTIAEEDFRAHIVPLFHGMAKEFGDVPIKAINDGDIAALAGAKMVGSGNLFGISLGSAEGGGYCDKDGNLLGWINEMSFVQLDLNPEAPTDFWTQQCHTGLSHMYLAQRGATRLAGRAGLALPDELMPDHPNMNKPQHEPHAKCFRLIQAAMADAEQEPKARLIYETIGVWLGYAVAMYAESYAIDHVVIMGGVSAGKGGELMLVKAKEVLDTEFPELARVQFHMPDDHFKRVGQCIAAAALPPL